MIRRRSLLGAAMALPALPGLARAQGAEWKPDRPITLVVPFAGGSGTDAVARILAELLGARIGVPVVVDNRAGANGTIAAVQAARAAPDGTTLFVTTNTTHSANPSLMKRIDYDPVADFTPVARVGNLPFMLVVGEEVKARSLRDLLEMARKSPGQVSYASGNSTGIVAGATMARMAGAEMLHVPYRSTPPAMTDVMAGRVTCMFVDIAAGLANVQAGKLRVLAMSTKERSALMPESPSMAEAGLEGFDITSWNGVFGPAKMRPEIVATLNAAIRQAIDRPEVKQRFAAIGFEAFSGPPETLDSFVRAELVKWRELIEAAGIEKE
ncbi:tripartite tricarboxylate transporter substrate binding protein [Pseudoroseomonas wenyumeiae]|uniref:Tripartite tricarboxylate transporter substrate binding protein n=1 Tax=Teichococcus wenyumeiae TaxID=2478470 RepID=A0A3A9JYU6_9PROT|nr:tripartite tricarboxylate transporter substrate-binding protein [Pseudoroseomonas wenyumeiae]RKK06018.1 tripartite tricarboxylate transporter substrate binding protein [Pseudoroseomonas wenyumeiae]RMI19535.1 tripartite tricarboxylate transporter substrate binding protein [Pseudoroseomonas wenyumeiae]